MVRFPKPKALRDQAPEGHYFLGTGPWTTLEYAVVWGDALLVAILAGMFARWLIARYWGLPAADGQRT